MKAYKLSPDEEEELLTVFSNPYHGGPALAEMRTKLRERYIARMGWEEIGDNAFEKTHLRFPGHRCVLAREKSPPRDMTPEQTEAWINRTPMGWHLTVGDIIVGRCLWDDVLGLPLRTANDILKVAELSSGWRVADACMLPEDRPPTHKKEHGFWWEPVEYQ